MDARMERELKDILETLGPCERQQVLKYARSLQHCEDAPKPDLMRFCGCITKEDAELMLQAIEEEFERV
jgi:hypothetical protein